MFKKVLVANRGVIACRILRTLKKMKIGSVAVYSEADRDARHVLDADQSVCLGAPPASESYLSIERVLEAAEKTGAEAIHPGYGFLSESVEFVRQCKQRGVVFIGPRIEQMEVFALRRASVAGNGNPEGSQEALEQAQSLGYPVILKSSAGGGGIGMRVCRTQ